MQNKVTTFIMMARTDCMSANCMSGNGMSGNCMSIPLFTCMYLKMQSFCVYMCANLQCQTYNRNETYFRLQFDNLNDVPLTYIHFYAKWVYSSFSRFSIYGIWLFLSLEIHNQNGYRYIIPQLPLKSAAQCTFKTN